jgi:hypothetical protein
MIWDTIHEFKSIGIDVETLTQGVRQKIRVQSRLFLLTLPTSLFRIIQY